MAARHNPARPRRYAPSATLSSTLIDAISLTCWNVRPMPRRAISYGGLLPIGAPRKRMSPAVSDNAPERTYNLVVADFSTYFVGKEKILSHDVTEKKTTHNIVPGLARAE